MSRHVDDQAADIRSELANQQLDFNLFATLKPKLFRDGNVWCVLYGENIQEGIVGFGKSPIMAIVQFNKEWYSTDNEKTTVSDE